MIISVRKFLNYKNITEQPTIQVLKLMSPKTDFIMKAN